MKQETIYEYPSGVLTGAPFTDVETGVRWLAQAEENEYPGASFSDYWLHPERLIPVLVTSPVEIVVIDPVDDTALRQAWSDYSNEHHSEERYPLDYPRMDATLRAVGRDHTIPELYLDHYRYLQGIHAFYVRSLATADNRREVGYKLHRIQDAIERSEVTLLRVINTHTGELWREAIMRGEITDPPNPHALNPTTKNPTGTPRLKR